ncbi:hypothetical protein [Dictyobacter formicarum]|uniref:Uncharacterized protein n=1 Tax=Dictyobacter formicarum TaxID=2778368 RepID=A0ABQ3VPN2_9CHLR|nr:hypothetical protein [Dictyobacter formicarum]GHO88214.1 hypothetical protein KSZ_62200 [Dictyobacter formicarum]
MADPKTLKWQATFGEALTISQFFYQQPITGLVMSRITLNGQVLAPEELLTLARIIQEHGVEIGNAAIHNQEARRDAYTKAYADTYFVPVQYDEDYTGDGPYPSDAVATWAYIPAYLVAEYGLERAFEMLMSVDKVHIIASWEHEPVLGANIR